MESFSFKVSQGPLTYLGYEYETNVTWRVEQEEMSFEPCLGRHRPGSWCVVRHGPRYFDLGQLCPAVGAQARWGGPSTKGVVSFCASCRWLRPQGR
jgi:hypothetical protein